MPTMFETMPKGRNILRISWGDAGKVYGNQEGQVLADLANGIAATIKKTSNIDTLAGQLARDINGNQIAVLLVQKP